MNHQPAVSSEQSGLATTSSTEKLPDNLSRTSTQAQRPVQSIVQVEHLRKEYPTRSGTVHALDDCSLEVESGAVFGLLGPNGAGKTTLIRTLLGYLRPTSGNARIAGFDCFTESVPVRRQVAYLPAEAKLFRSMRGRSVLEFFSHMHPQGSWERSLKLADRLRLDLSRRVAFMSTGMRQKLALAAVLGCQTPLLILDEPTANLDPTVRQEILCLIREANQQGRTILFCSHVLQEIEEVCSQAAIMRSGRVVHQVDIQHLKSIHRVRGLGTLPKFDLPSGVTLHAQQGDEIKLDVEGALESFLPWIHQLGWRGLRIEPVGLRSIYERYHFPQTEGAS